MPPEADRKAHLGAQEAAAGLHKESEIGIADEGVAVEVAGGIDKLVAGDEEDLETRSSAMPLLTTSPEQKVLRDGAAGLWGFEICECSKRLALALSAGRFRVWFRGTCADQARLSSPPALGQFVGAEKLLFTESKSTDL